MTFIKPGVIADNLVQFFRCGSAIGGALAIGLMLSAVMIAIVVLSAPVRMSVDFEFSQFPVEARPSIRETSAESLTMVSGFSDCFWMPPNGGQVQSNPESPVTPVSARVRCFVPDPFEQPDLRRTSTSLAEQFDTTPGWTREDMTIRVEPMPAGLDALLWLVPLLVPALWLLLRNLDHRVDFKRAGHAIASQPWILLAAPAAALTISSLGSMVIPPDQAMREHSLDMLASMAPPFWLLVFVLPLVEEAIFRQWLYVRIIDRLPLWVVAVSSSWAFMLLHIFNPATIALAVYLPTMFALGITFFWLRHRFQSFTLAVIAHAFNNGLFFGLGALISG